MPSGPAHHALNQYWTDPNISPKSPQKMIFLLFHSVALNFQTAGEGMDVNDGLFSQNGCCGYVLKPSFMREADVRFDPEMPQKRDHYHPVVLTVQVKERFFIYIFIKKSMDLFKSDVFTTLNKMCVFIKCNEGDQWSAVTQSQHQRRLYSGSSGQSGGPWSSYGPGQARDEIYWEQRYILTLTSVW